MEVEFRHQDSVGLAKCGEFFFALIEPGAQLDDELLVLTAGNDRELYFGESRIGRGGQ
jgi:hypothetical protein